VFLPSRPDLAARLANLALGRDIETAYVRALIDRHRLVAPDDACAQWPFRLRVRALNGFELTRDGEPMHFTGKTQQRPLDLLKLVVALGGKDVDAESIMAALWPDAEGSAAKNSFDSAMFRLRKLLDVDDAIAVTSGSVSLNRAIVWTDVEALTASAAALALTIVIAAPVLRAPSERIFGAEIVGVPPDISFAGDLKLRACGAWVVCGTVTLGIEISGDDGLDVSW